MPSLWRLTTMFRFQIIMKYIDDEASHFPYWDHTHCHYESSLIYWTSLWTQLKRMNICVQDEYSLSNRLKSISKQMYNFMNFTIQDTFFYSVLWKKKTIFALTIDSFQHKIDVHVSLFPWAQIYSLHFDFITAFLLLFK